MNFELSKRLPSSSSSPSPPKMPGSRLSLLCAILATLLILLAVKTIWFFKSHHHTGLDDSLCKCEQFHAGHGGRPTQSRMVNGTEFTSPHGLSWVASIGWQLSENTTQEFKWLFPDDVANQTQILFESFCTGSILNGRMVIVAAHCIQDYLTITDRLLVAFGSNHDLNSIYCSQIREGPDGTKICNLDAKNPHKRRVTKIHMHPDYFDMPLKDESSVEFWEKSIFPDIAVIEVEQFDLSDELNILPGCLFESEKHFFGGNLLAAGYGAKVGMGGRSVETNSNEKIFQILTSRGDTKLSTNQFKQIECEHRWNIGNSSKKDAVLCVTNEYGAICDGDSGGPLHYSEDGSKLFIVGVLSAHFLNETETKAGRCVPGEIAIYISTVHHLEWIRSIAGDELCLTNRFRWTPREWTFFLIGLALPTLAATLTGFLIAIKLRRPQNEEGVGRCNTVGLPTSRSSSRQSKY